MTRCIVYVHLSTMEKSVRIGGLGSGYIKMLCRTIVILQMLSLLYIDVWCRALSVAHITGL